MRDKNLNFQKFVIQFSSQVTNSAAFRRMLELRMTVVDNPNFLKGSWSFRNIPKKLSEVEALAICSWYFPNEIRILLHFELIERLRNYSLDDQIVLKTILHSREQCLLFLNQSNKYSTRDFFGNVLRVGLRVASRLNITRDVQKVKKPQRKRGYHDHGTLVPIHKKDPNKYIDTRKEQQQIEKRRTIFQDTLDFLTGLIQ